MSTGRGVPATPARVALVGIHGFGAIHRRNLARLEALGRVRLVAAADPAGAEPGELDGVPVYADLGSLLEATSHVDIVIVSTPIPTHMPLALSALAAGADVYLEKPPVASAADFDRLTAAADAAGARIQVGFQSLGSHALPEIASIIARGEIGDVRAISAIGLWSRDRAYFARARWAGRRMLDGVPVVDGVATNALSHAVATALALAGARQADDVRSIQADLYRAHDVESDDTSVVRIITSRGHTVTCALTLAAAAETEPEVRIDGALGTITLSYTTDEVVVSVGDDLRRLTFERTDLLENLLDHRETGTPLLSSLADSGAYMQVLESIRIAPAPQPIPQQFVTWIGEGSSARPVVRNIEDAARRACAAGATFQELGLPWARPEAGSLTLTVESTAAARENEGTALQRALSPRPYLHPVSTLQGTVLTDAMPLDHPWHLGVGVAVPDVDGVNFWGGPTFVRAGSRYEWRHDQGRIVRSGLTPEPTGPLEELAWLDADGRTMLRERRRLRWSHIDESCWQLTLQTSLTTAGDHAVSLGSPASNGRPGAGYGGLFWRFAPCTDTHVFTAEREVESQTHGTVTPWLAWEATFDGGRAGVVFLAPPESADPWFVRVSEYPAVGSALAWGAAARVKPGTPLVRTYSMIIVDGPLTRERAESLASRNIVA
ncbi:Predicted dehydrogenase [Paramicrobacterium humi]|uniref:Predicted dehydrogenase n=1 Tax=Paramicrobacterium humi TaxID=640635 RepID=A0A1H4IY64_9MICO|nr:DUF6807 family protein [Microbacterium humi]SEB38989.1 Predicted dehydrogenase [Microbacterium humi]